MKKVFLYFCLLIFTVLLMTTSVAAAYPNIYIIPGGDSIGLYLETGIYITGKYEVQTAGGDIAPWKKSDIKVGDKILDVNNEQVNKIEDIQNMLADLEEECAFTLKIRRNNEIIFTDCRVIKTISNNWSLGIYVKDHVLGIGTVTYIHPETKTFGALGHSVVNEELSGKIGYISSSTINGIKKSVPGRPGDKQAILNDDMLGFITKNTKIGIYGTINNETFDRSAPKMKIAAPNEVKIGPAEIWTVLNGKEKERFAVNIIEVKRQNTGAIKGIKIQITDQRLLEVTGGIIQGMSGSPIIQNNKLVGAVSHVLIDAPDLGYGVFAMWMVSNNVSQFGY